MNIVGFFWGKSCYFLIVCVCVFVCVCVWCAHKHECVHTRREHYAASYVISQDSIISLFGDSVSHTGTRDLLVQLTIRPASLRDLLVSASLAPRLQRAHRHTFIIFKTWFPGIELRSSCLQNKTLSTELSPQPGTISCCFQTINASSASGMTSLFLHCAIAGTASPSLVYAYSGWNYPEIPIWGDKRNRKISSGKCSPCYNSVGKPSSSLLVCHYRRVECFQGQPFLPTTL